ncbi:phage protease [Desulfobacula sp.]|uniref:phage protease n=1 Tax=Desulfobacula sp. TaxID=2593537 RepID=UPI0025B8403F|nr:phage protease [Desulfobacula sp.]MBC2703985.1 hypothetical protein [Desulfobacula sp.]
MKTIISSGPINNALHEFQLFPYGESELEGQHVTKITVDKESMSHIIAEFERRGNDVVVDYEHQTIREGKAPAAGWISKLIDKGSEGLWAAVTWTEKAKSFLKNKEYRYYSPVFHVRKADSRVIRILSVALTNMPRLNNLKPVYAKLRLVTGKAGHLVISQDQQRLNEMMGLELEDYLEYASEIPNSLQLFETDEEKINHLLPND